MGISKCRAAPKKVECVYLYGGEPYSPRETKRCFVFWLTQLVLCLQNNPGCTHLNIRGGEVAKQPLPHKIQAWGQNLQILQILGTNNSKTPELTHHHIMPLNLYLFAGQLFAFQFETGKSLISAPGIGEWKCFNGIVTGPSVKISHLFSPTQHLRSGGSTAQICIGTRNFDPRSNH